MTPVIEVEGLTRRFGDFVAVDDVSFEVEEGEIFGYLGANGAGKSTTIKMLCGLLAPSAGRARVAGHDISESSRAVKSAIGYMSQKFSLYLDLPVRANLEFYAGAYEIERPAARVREILELLHLEEHADHATGALPGGIRQRLGLGCALLHRPKIVFLDEPTAGVDPASRRDFWRLIRSLSHAGTTVFVTTHYMDEAEYCQRIGLMVDGRLMALDTPKALKRDLVPGRLFRVAQVETRALRPILLELPSVADVQPFGTQTHVRVREDGPSAEALQAKLGGAGLSSAEVVEIEPTLEDVFLAAVDPSNKAGVP